MQANQVVTYHFLNNRWSCMLLLRIKYVNLWNYSLRNVSKILMARYYYLIILVHEYTAYFSFPITVLHL